MTDTYTIAELKALISERRSRMVKLKTEHRKLSRRLAQIDNEIGNLGGSLGRTGIRPRNDKNLIDVMDDVLRENGKPMRVGDITDAVHAAGYRSSSANFRGIVNQTLIKDKRFIAAARGLYQLKK